MNAGTVIEPSE
jgi:hypothetical protein